MVCDFCGWVIEGPVASAFLSWLRDTLQSESWILDQQKLLETLTDYFLKPLTCFKVIDSVHILIERPNSALLLDKPQHLGG